jgi:hypothetical protein
MAIKAVNCARCAHNAHLDAGIDANAVSATVLFESKA